MCNMKKLFILLIVLGSASLTHAQVWGRLSSKKPLKVPQKSAKTTLKTISYYGGIHGAAMGVDFHLARTVSAAEAVRATTTGVSSKPRSWLTQQQRDIKAWQLKKQRAENQKKQLELAKQQADIEAAKAAAPLLLTEHAFIVTDFTDFIPSHNQQPRPKMPFVPEPKVVAYRGLALAADGDALRNILSNGLLLKDAGEENSTLRIAYASHGGYEAVKHFIEHPVTNVTYGPQSAANWGTRRMEKTLPILTVVKIRGSFSGKSLDVVTEDIPANQIEEVIVRLNIHDTLTWCKVELNPDNTFTLTPYQTAAQPHF